MPDTQRQDRHWSRAAARYDDLFLDPFRPGVENPLLDELQAVPDPASKTVADLGCGTGPLLPHLVGRFGRVVALDFAPGMILRFNDEDFGWLVAVDPHALALPGVDQDLGAAGRRGERERVRRIQFFLPGVVD